MRLVSSIFQSRRKRGERVGASAIKLLHENKMQGFSLFIERDISDKKQIVFLNSLFQQQIQLSQLPTRRFYVFVFNKNFCKNKQQFNVWLFLIKVRLEQLARTTETKTKSQIISRFQKYQPAQLVLNCKRFSYFRPFTHDIITQNTTRKKIMYLYRGYSASMSFERGKE